MSKCKEYIEKGKVKYNNLYDYSEVEAYYISCNDPVPIKCTKHLEIFKMSVIDHITRGRCGCKGCIADKKRIAFSDTKEQFIAKSKKKYPNANFVYDKVKYINARTKVSIKCPKHGYFKQTPDDHLGGRCGCRKCSILLRASKRRITFAIFKKHARKAHGKKYSYKKETYKSFIQTMTMTCPEHGDFQLLPKTHLQGSGCRKCGIDGRGEKTAIEMPDQIIVIKESVRKPKPLPKPKVIGRTMKQYFKDRRSLNKQLFIDRANIYHENKYNYSKVVYKNCYSKMCIICHDHGEFNQTAIEHYRYGCRKCAQITNGKKLCKTTEQFIEQSIKVHGDKYDYSKVKYINNWTKVIIICKKHGEFEQHPYNHCGKIKCGCPSCNESKGEKILDEQIKKLGFLPIRQKRFGDCKDTNCLPFDFYIVELNLCIEYDGQQHYEEVAHWGGAESLEKVQEHDDIKNEYCKKNGIGLIRIPYFADNPIKLLRFELTNYRINRINERLIKIEK